MSASTDHDADEAGRSGVGRARATFRHEPVMVDEIVEVFAAVPPGTIFDATLGGGGHSDAILTAQHELEVFGCDRDAEAVDVAAQRLARHGDRVRIVHSRFDRAASGLAASGSEGLSGFLFDLGVSSHQLDTPARGFSFRGDGPLDMRMDASEGIDAASIVNESDERDLVRLLERNADETHARRIAAAIVASRPVQSTGELAQIVREAVPMAARRAPGHPARKTFQALRIAVNDELTVLGPALRTSLDMLVPRGRGVVLAYHSGEDRIVKDVFREVAEPVDDLPGLPVDLREEPSHRLLWRRPRRPSEDEVARNPRAQSARLRAIERSGASS